MKVAEGKTVTRVKEWMMLAIPSNALYAPHTFKDIELTGDALPIFAHEVLVTRIEWKVDAIKGHDDGRCEMRDGEPRLPHWMRIECANAAPASRKMLTPFFDDWHETKGYCDFAIPVLFQQLTMCVIRLDGNPVDARVRVTLTAMRGEERS